MILVFHVKAWPYITRFICIIGGTGNWKYKCDTNTIIWTFWSFEQRELLGLSGLEILLFFLFLFLLYIYIYISETRICTNWEKIKHEKDEKSFSWYQIWFWNTRGIYFNQCTLYWHPFHSLSALYLTRDWMNYSTNYPKAFGWALILMIHIRYKML